MTRMASAIKAAPRNERVADTWMTVNEAAVQLKTSRYLVLKRAAAGEFSSAMVAGRVVLDRASVERAISNTAA